MPVNLTLYLWHIILLIKATLLHLPFPSSTDYIPTSKQSEENRLMLRTKLHAMYLSSFFFALLCFALAYELNAS